MIAGDNSCIPNLIFLFKIRLIMLNCGLIFFCSHVESLIPNQIVCFFSFSFEFVAL